MVAIVTNLMNPNDRKIVDRTVTFDMPKPATLADMERAWGNATVYALAWSAGVVQAQASARDELKLKDTKRKTEAAIAAAHEGYKPKLGRVTDPAARVASVAKQASKMDVEGIMAAFGVDRAIAEQIVKGAAKRAGEAPKVLSPKAQITANLEASKAARMAKRAKTKPAK